MKELTKLVSVKNKTLCPKNVAEITGTARKVKLSSGQEAKAVTTLSDVSYWYKRLLKTHGKSQETASLETKKYKYRTLMMNQAITPVLIFWISATDCLLQLVAKNCNEGVLQECSRIFSRYGGVQPGAGGCDAGLQYLVVKQWYNCRGTVRKLFGLSWLLKRGGCKPFRLTSDPAGGVCLEYTVDRSNNQI